MRKQQVSIPKQQVGDSNCETSHGERAQDCSKDRLAQSQASFSPQTVAEMIKTNQFKKGWNKKFPRKSCNVLKSVQDRFPSIQH